VQFLVETHYVIKLALEVVSKTILKSSWRRSSCRLKDDPHVVSKTILMSSQRRSACRRSII